MIGKLDKLAAGVGAAAAFAGVSATDLEAGSCIGNVCQDAKREVCMQASSKSDQIAQRLSKLISSNPDASRPGTAAYAECARLRAQLAAINSMRTYCGSIGGSTKTYIGGERVR
jgi:hypothetical protein